MLSANIIGRCRRAVEDLASLPVGESMAGRVWSGNSNGSRQGQSIEHKVEKRPLYLRSGGLYIVTGGSPIAITVLGEA